MKISLSRWILIILVLLIVAIVCGIYWYMFCPENNQNENRYEVTTSLKDKFLVSEQLLNKYPDYTYNIEIFDYTNTKKKSVLKLDNVEKDANDDEISYLFSNDDIKAYSYINYIIYKEKSSESFKSLWIGDIEKLDPTKYMYLIPVAKEITNKNWKFAHLVSEFLIKSNDSDAINTIKRYAKGEFTSEEIENNKYSGYSKDEMKEYFKGLLLKYNIKISTKDK
jgi:hypothetical protein